MDVNDGFRRLESNERADGACAERAIKQFGVIHRDQAIGAGLSARAVDRRTASGRWARIHRGVYRIGAAPPSWEQAVMAALLWAGEGAAASHRTAAALWRLEGATRETVEITSPRDRRSKNVVVHLSTLPASDVTRIGVMPVTTVPRTLLDLGGVAAPSVVESALADALRRRLTTAVRLRRQLSALDGRRHRGAKALRQALDFLATPHNPLESVLEARLLRMLKRSRLPEPVAQYEVRPGIRVDLAYPDARLAIEADGYRYHSGREAWRRDLSRRNALMATGWRVLHVTWHDIQQRPQELAEQVREALAAATAQVSG